MQKARVAIIMGSKSDWETMKKAAELLKEFGIESESKVASAHRTPDYTNEYVRGAKARGIEVVIAGAGLAAHLPGVAAAMTTLPVIGVPISSKAFGGMDSLLSIVQMPPGVPVACVGVDNSKNAAVLAARIIALHDKDVEKRLAEYTKKAADEIKAAKLE
jgi:5-(carboxyamino)imidazole ribonucleotide mutase